MSDITIRQAARGDEKAVYTLISSLLGELDPEGGDNYGEAQLMPSVEEFLTKEYGVSIFMAEDGSGEAQGVITINECRAIYALGAFGEISELYVKAGARSSGLGEKLIQQAEQFAKTKGWTRLEVGAPDLPKWQCSVDFYHRCGFGMVGPRLSKNILGV